MGTLISIPGVSQLLGCTPLGPFGWAQALGTATVATAGAAVIPPLLTMVRGAPSADEAEVNGAAPRLRVVGDDLDGAGSGRPDSSRSGIRRFLMVDKLPGTSQREAVQRIREAETFAIELPVVGQVTVPRPEQLAYYGGLGLLAVFGLLDWPVALVIAAGHILASNHHNHVLEELGEAMEEI